MKIPLEYNDCLEIIKQIKKNIVKKFFELGITPSSFLTLCK